MKFTYVTLFQSLIEGYFEDSILKRAIDKQLFSVDYCNPRDFSVSKHNKVDDTASGGGAGMVMLCEPLFGALRALEQKSSKNKEKIHFIFTTPVGKPFTQNDAKRLAKKEHIVFVSGRYEGIDERVIETFADELFSIGDYVLTGGELPSLVMSDAIARNVQGVLGNSESLVMESFESELLEAPSFTKPQVFKGLPIPKEFAKGNHSKIRELKLELSQAKTKFFRPERMKKYRKMEIL